MVAPLGMGAPGKGSATAGAQQAQAATQDTDPEAVVKKFYQAGQADRATHFAITYASLNSKLEELQKKKEACVVAQKTLLKAAEDEGSKLPKSSNHEDLTWGLALTNAVIEQVNSKLQQAAKDRPANQAEMMAREARQQVTQAFESKRKAEADAQSQAMMQGEAAKRAKAQAAASQFQTVPKQGMGANMAPYPMGPYQGYGAGQGYGVGQGYGAGGVGQGYGAGGAGAMGGGGFSRW